MRDSVVLFGVSPVSSRSRNSVPTVEREGGLSPSGWRLDCVRLPGLWAIDVSDIGGPMGHLNFTPPDNVLSPRFTQWMKVEADARLPDTEDITLTKIAERFAPGARSVVVSASNHHATRAAPIPASSPRGRALVAVPIVVAWLPIVTFGAMSWLGLINMPRSAPMTSGNNESARPPVQDPTGGRHSLGRGGRCDSRRSRQATTD